MLEPTLFFLVCLYLIVGVIGVILNVISMCILTKRIQRIPGARLLLGLAVADGSLLLVGTTVVATGMLCVPDKCSFAFLDTIQDPIVFAVWRWLFTAEIYLVVALAVDRYIAVAKPLSLLRWRPRTRQKWAVLTVFGVSLLVVVPSFLEDRYIACPYEGAISCYETTHKTWNNVTKATASLNMTYFLSPESKKANTTTDMYLYNIPADRLLSSANDTEARTEAVTLATELEDRRINWYELLHTYAFSWALQYVIPIVCLVVLNYRLI